METYTSYNYSEARTGNYASALAYAQLVIERLGAAKVGDDGSVIEADPVPCPDLADAQSVHEDSEPQARFAKAA